jgi:mRNA interferase MazF
MKRGEVWTVAGGPDYAGKPRPVVIVQDDAFDETGSVTVCALTSDPTDAPLFRVLVEPSPNNGLRLPSRVMADKITTVSRGKLGEKIGDLTKADMENLSRAMLVFLGLVPTRRG